MVLFSIVLQTAKTPRKERKRAQMQPVGTCTSSQYLYDPVPAELAEKTIDNEPSGPSFHYSNTPIKS